MSQAPRHWTIAYLSLLIVVLAGFALRMTTLENQSLWRDEVDAMCYAYDFPRALVSAVVPTWESSAAPPSACPPTPIAPNPNDPSTSLTLQQVLKRMIRQNGPLYFFFLRLWINAAGTSVTAMRFFSLWFGVLSIPLIYSLGRRLLDHATGAAAAFLVALSPHLVWYSQEVKMYTLVPALALLSVYALRRAVEGDGARWWAVQIAVTSLALYTHIWSAMLIPVQIALFILWWPQSRRHWRGGLVSLALLTLPYLPLAVWEITHAFAPRETGLPNYALLEMLAALIQQWSTGVTQWGWPMAGIATGVAILIGGMSPWLASGRRQKGWMLAGLLLWCIIPVLGIWFISQWQPLFLVRYLIWTAPAFYLLIGAGLAFLWQHGRWPALPLLAALGLVFGANLFQQSTHAIKADFLHAAATVEDKYQEGDLIIFQIPHGRYTFDYYISPLDYAWSDGLYTNHVDEAGEYIINARQAAAHMTRVTRQHERVWLVLSEMEMWDRRGLVRTWLDNHGVRAEAETFRYVEVIRYELDGAP